MLEFLKDRGGSVQQIELIDHFLSDCVENESSEDEERREILRRIVDTVGFVKVEDGVKFVCLNSESSAESVMRSGSDADGQPRTECNGNIHFVNGNPGNGQQTGESDKPTVSISLQIMLSRTYRSTQSIHVTRKCVSSPEIRIVKQTMIL